MASSSVHWSAASLGNELSLPAARVERDLVDLVAFEVLECQSGDRDLYCPRLG
jgi:hypothetical protein